METLSDLSPRQSFVSVVQRVKQGRSQVNVGDVMSDSFKSDAVSHANIMSSLGYDNSRRRFSEVQENVVSTLNRKILTCVVLVGWLNMLSWGI